MLSTPKADPKDVELQKTFEAAAAAFFDSFKIIPPLAIDLSVK